MGTVSISFGDRDSGAHRSLNRDILCMMRPAARRTGRSSVCVIEGLVEPVTVADAGRYPDIGACSMPTALARLAVRTVMVAVILAILMPVVGTAQEAADLQEISNLPPAAPEDVVVPEPP